ncbi:thioredoxin family protein [Flavihumibacter sp. ZG627]|uniref:thioredoxin family protein n=1 Tax=Flavihumibacter sp. ZG627 TaxID=1463156 RepID=UPI00057C679D|nr:thioredoxin family protein [Flavihumibacter sp. ZG627]KIC91084.1 thiol-disulfide isomerase [Flavihumibacter sp. ZG627]
MRLIILLALMAGLYSFTDWGHDMDKAQVKARQENKLILLNFSGSDWCAPCIRLKKQIFADDRFKKFADEKLVLVNADFPRGKKFQLPKDQQEHNNNLAEKYNTEGDFPLTLLLSADGKVLKKWEGLPQGDAKSFVAELNQACLAAH